MTMLDLADEFSYYLVLAFVVDNPLAADDLRRQ
jgi:hypothetical protein